MPIFGFLGENKKPDEKKIFKNEDANDLLTLQIKYALNKINAQYVNKSNLIKLPFCDYYCNYHLNNNNLNNNNNTINNNEKKNKNNKYNIYYNKFSVGLKFNNYKNFK